MKNATKYIIDGLKMISILAGAFLLCLLLETKFSAETVPPAVMAMAVFFVSRFTDGFVYGIIASLLSVLVLNFAFAFRFQFQHSGKYYFRGDHACDHGNDEYDHIAA